MSRKNDRYSGAIIPSVENVTRRCEWKIETEKKILWYLRNNTNPSIFSGSSRSRCGSRGSLCRRLTSFLWHVLRGWCSADGDSARRHRGTHSGHHYINFFFFKFSISPREFPSQIIRPSAWKHYLTEVDHFTDNPNSLRSMSPSLSNTLSIDARSDWRESQYECKTRWWIDDVMR